MEKIISIVVKDALTPNQRQIQDFVLEETKFGDGSGDRLRS